MENIAYIDGSNLYLGVKNIGVEIDYLLLRQWLKNKYQIKKAYVFMGYLPEQQSLYDYLERCDFILVFKETLLQRGIIKGNADAELVLKAVRDIFETKDEYKVVLISGDGDFSCLIDFFIEKKVFKILLIPNRKYSSYLLRKKNIAKEFLETPRILSQIKKRKDP